jgi:hypothetical protein
MNTELLKQEILIGAKEVSRLHARIHETFKYRGKSPKDRDVWSLACAEFHARYNELAFPGGYERAEARIVAGDEETIESALCFLELRPYFFRSGYMYQSLLRKMKRAALTKTQAQRLQVVLAKLDEWRVQKANAKSGSLSLPKKPTAT